MVENVVKRSWLYIVWCVLMLILCLPYAAADSEGKDRSEDAESVFNLNEIVVTGTKTPYHLKDVPVQTEVITAKDIEKTSVQTVSDILRSVPGFFAVSEDIPGETSWRSSLRGLDFNSGYGLILIDGQRVKGGGMGEYGVGVNQIPVSMIERIEIIKGPASVLYGSDALIGVVNIITKSCRHKAVYGTEISGGSQDTRMVSAYAGVREGPISGYINAAVNESSIGAYGLNSSRDEEYHVNRVDSKLSYEVNKHINCNFQMAFEDEDRSRIYKTQDVIRNNWYKKYRVAPTVNLMIDDTSEAVLSGYYLDWSMDAMEAGSDSSGFSPTIGNMYYKDIEARYTKRFQNMFQMTAGLEFLQEDLDYSFADKTIDTLSGYAQVEIEPVDLLSIVLGMRIDDHSQFGNHFSPKLSLMFKPFVDTIIRGSVGKGFKSPTIRQLYYEKLYQHGDYWYRSNSDLEPEKSLGYSLGIEQMILDRIILEGAVFRNDIEDKVLQVDTDDEEDGLPVVTFDNVSKAYTQGIEAGIKALIGKGLTTRFSYTFTDTEDEDSGNEITYIPKHNITCNLTYFFAPFGITFSVDAQFVDDMYTNSSNTEKTDTYSLFDAKISKKWHDKYTISIEGNNLSDSDYGQPDREWLGQTYLVKFKIDI